MNFIDYYPDGHLQKNSRKTAGYPAIGHPVPNAPGGVLAANNI